MASLRTYLSPRHIWQQLKQDCHTPIDGASLAIARISLGLVIFYDAVRKSDMSFDRNEGKLFQFTYPFFDWVRDAGPYADHVSWCLIIASVCVTIGLCYRLAITICFVLISYMFLLAREYYLNHYYLLIIICFLMVLVPAHRRFSVDSLILTMPRHLPKIHLTLMRGQLEIVLLYAGIVKINPDWLRLEPIGSWLRESVNDVWYGVIWNYEWGVILSSYGPIALHIIGAPLLLYKRTRLVVFVLYCVFHVTNHYIFNIGIFPWMTIALSTLFFDPDWPVKLARRIAGAPWNSKALPSDTPTTLNPRHYNYARMTLIWLIFQALFPLRHYLYPGNAAWTNEAHNFSWRMKLLTRRSPGFVIAVHVPSLQRIYIPDYQTLLSKRQYRKSSTRPALMHQLARQTADYYRAKLGVDTLYTHVVMPYSYNYRPPRIVIDPTIDLGNEPIRNIRPDPWLLPEVPAPPGSAEAYRAANYPPPQLHEALYMMGMPNISLCAYDDVQHHVACTIAPYE